MKNIFLVLVLAFLFIGCGCDDAMVANRNVTKAADNFEVHRRIVFYNGWTGEYMLTIEGKCSIHDDGLGQLEVLCKTGNETYKKHFLGLSDNITYFAEQLDGIELSVHHYRVTFKPEVIIPDIRKQ